MGPFTLPGPYPGSSSSSISIRSGSLCIEERPLGWVGGLRDYQTSSEAIIGGRFNKHHKIKSVKTSPYAIGALKISTWQVLIFLFKTSADNQPTHTDTSAYACQPLYAKAFSTISDPSCSILSRRSSNRDL